VNEKQNAFFVFFVVLAWICVCVCLWLRVIIIDTNDGNETQVLPGPCVGFRSLQRSESVAQTVCAGGDEIHIREEE